MEEINENGTYKDYVCTILDEVFKRKNVRDLNYQEILHCEIDKLHVYLLKHTWQYTGFWITNQKLNFDEYRNILTKYGVYLRGVLQTVYESENNKDFLLDVSMEKTVHNSKYHMDEIFSVVYKYTGNDIIRRIGMYEFDENGKRAYNNYNFKDTQEELEEHLNNNLNKLNKCPQKSKESIIAYKKAIKLSKDFCTVAKGLRDMTTKKETKSSSSKLDNNAKSNEELEKILDDYKSQIDIKEAELNEIRYRNRLLYSIINARRELEKLNEQINEAKEKESIQTAELEKN